MAAEVFDGFIVHEKVGFVERDDLRKRSEAFVVLFELGVYGAVVGDGVSALAAGNIDNVDDEPRAVDVAQKLGAQSHSVACALDKPRYVGDDERAVIAFDYAEVWRQRGKVVICYFGFCRGNDGQQRGLSHVGITHEPHVRDCFKLERDGMLVGHFARLRKARRFSSRRLESRVALAAIAAFKHGHGRVFLIHIRNDFARFGVADYRAARHLYNQIGGVFAVTEAAAAVLAVRGAEVLLIAEVGERVKSLVDRENHVAALAAVAAVRTSVGHIFLGVKRGAAVAAVARLYINLCFIDKHIVSPHRLALLSLLPIFVY